MSCENCGCVPKILADTFNRLTKQQKADLITSVNRNRTSKRTSKRTGNIIPFARNNQRGMTLNEVMNAKKWEANQPSGSKVRAKMTERSKRRVSADLKRIIRNRESIEAGSRQKNTVLPKQTQKKSKNKNKRSKNNRNIT